MTLRLTDPADDAEGFELDPITPRDLPKFRAALREQLGSDESEPLPMLHTAESVALLASALPGARELGLSPRPYPSDDAIAIEEGVELDAGDFETARDQLTGALALLDALQRDAEHGHDPDELSIRTVVRAELGERNRDALALFREAGMLPLQRAELSERERATLDAAMPDLRDGSKTWLACGATVEDLVGVVIAGQDGEKPMVTVCTCGGFRALAQHHRASFSAALVSHVTRSRNYPGQTEKRDALTVVVWSGETIYGGLPGGRDAFMKRPVFTEVSLRTDN